MSQVSHPMRDQIADQPAALRALLARQDEIARIVAHATSGTERIWAVGHGDSFFAPLAAAAAFGRWTRLPYRPLTAQEMAAYPPSGLDATALVIAISMSGGGRSIDAAHVARSRGARVLVITNTPGSPLTQVADQTVLLGITEPVPFLAGTVTYTASVLALIMIASLLSSAETDRSVTVRPGPTTADRAGALSSLRHAVSALDAAVAIEPVIRESVFPLARARVWYLLGMGCQEATARYGAAKMAEVADAIGIPHETEEFFHEHHWVMTRDDAVVIIAHDEPSRRRSAAAAAQLQELEIPVWLIGGDAIDGVRHVPLGDVDPWASPLSAAVALQWLAYWLSRAKGLDPDQRSHLRGSPRYVVSRKYR